MRHAPEPASRSTLTPWAWGIRLGRVIGVVLIVVGAVAGVWIQSTLNPVTHAMTGFDQVVAFAAIVSGLMGAYVLVVEA
jgi:uncharacterized membrane protein YeaQ/YmgE (transglycosylase-associated protein family)